MFGVPVRNGCRAPSTPWPSCGRRGRASASPTTAGSTASTGCGSRRHRRSLGPPILLGGYVDAALRRAGEIGDGHITDADDMVHVRKAVTLMGEGARRLGATPSGCIWR